MPELQNLATLKAQDKQTLKSSISEWRSTADKATKALPKLVHAYTRDVPEGDVAQIVRDELGFDMRTEIQHLYQLRNIIASIDAKTTTLTEKDYDEIPNSTLVAFHRHMSTDLEPAAVEIIRDGKKVRQRLIDLGKPAPLPEETPAPAAETENPSPAITSIRVPVLDPSRPVVEETTATTPPAEEAPPTPAAPAAETSPPPTPTAETPPAPTPAAPAKEGLPPATVDLTNISMWLELREQLTQLTPEQLAKTETIMRGFLTRIDELKGAAQKAA